MLLLLLPLPRAPCARAPRPLPSAHVNRAGHIQSTGPAVLPAHKQNTGKWTRTLAHPKPVGVAVLDIVLVGSSL